MSQNGFQDVVSKHRGTLAPSWPGSAPKATHGNNSTLEEGDTGDHATASSPGEANPRQLRSSRTNFSGMEDPNRPHLPSVHNWGDDLEENLKTNTPSGHDELVLDRIVDLDPFTKRYLFRWTGYGPEDDTRGAVQSFGNECIGTMLSSLGPASPKEVTRRT